MVGNCIRSEWITLVGEERLSEEQPNRIRDRLVMEILADNFTGSLFLIGLMKPKDNEVQPRQSLLAH